MTTSRHDAADFFESVYTTQPPDGSTVTDAGWDIGEPQPLVIELEHAGQIGGNVLDIGCGTGDNALYLASRGHTVTGLDAAPTAIAHAQAKAAQRGLAAEFGMTDARELAGYDNHFDTVIDCGLFHVFAEADRTRYTAALRRACRRNAVVHILAVSDIAPAGPGPFRLTAEQIRDAFTDGWTIDALRRVDIQGALPEQGTSDLPLSEIALSDIPLSAVPSWLMTAHRSA